MLFPVVFPIRGQPGNSGDNRVPRHCPQLMTRTVACDNFCWCSVCSTGGGRNIELPGQVHPPQTLPTAVALLNDIIRVNTSQLCGCYSEPSAFLRSWSGSFSDLHSIGFVCSVPEIRSLKNRGLHETNVAHRRTLSSLQVIEFLITRI